MNSVVYFVFNLFYWFSKLLNWKDDRFHERREVYPILSGELDDISQYEMYEIVHKELDGIAERLSQLLDKKVISVFAHSEDCVIFWGDDIGVCAEVTFESYCGLPSKAFVKTKLGDEGRKLFASLYYNFMNDRFEILTVFIPAD